MLLFDLSHDRMSPAPLADLLDVQAAFIFQEDRYAEAARRMGLSPGEFAEVERRVIAGQVGRTTLPTRLDAMAGMRHGRVYVLRSIRVRDGERTFVIALASGKRVYVPARCGNLSLLRSAPPRVVSRPAPRPRTFVAVARPVAPAPAPPAPASPPSLVAAVSPPAPAPVDTPGRRPIGFFVASWLANAIHSVSTTSPHTLPPCSAGTTSDAGGCTGP